MNGTHEITYLPAVLPPAKRQRERRCVPQKLATLAAVALNLFFGRGRYRPSVVLLCFSATVISESSTTYLIDLLLEVWLFWPKTASHT
jgi:hypothetical protein